MKENTLISSAIYALEFNNHNDEANAVRELNKRVKKLEEQNSLIKKSNSELFARIKELDYETFPYVIADINGIKKTLTRSEANEIQEFCNIFNISFEIIDYAE